MRTWEDGDLWVVACRISRRRISVSGWGQRPWSISHRNSGRRAERPWATWEQRETSGRRSNHADQGVALAEERRGMAAGAGWAKAKVADRCRWALHHHPPIASPSADEVCQCCWVQLHGVRLRLRRQRGRLGEAASGRWRAWGSCGDVVVGGELPGGPTRGWLVGVAATIRALISREIEKRQTMERTVF